MGKTLLKYAVFANIKVFTIIALPMRDSSRADSLYVFTSLLELFANLKLQFVSNLRRKLFLIYQLFHTRRVARFGTIYTILKTRKTTKEEC